ncbi:hypothetical protein VKS41_001719 [Umbelopsis sp. WA50703]
MSTTLPIAQTQYIVQIVFNSAIILSILLAFMVCGQRPRFHVYLLILANLCGIIFSALSLHMFINSDYYTGAILVAIWIFNYSFYNLAILVGFFALQQLTKSYLGGTMLWIKVASTLASLWTIVIIILSGITGWDDSIFNITNIALITSIVVWSNVALCAFLLLVLIGVRITYNNRVPSGKARRQAVIPFALIGLYVSLLTVYSIVANVIPYVPGESKVLVANLVVGMLLYRAPGFLFAIFYRRLSVMPPYVAQTDVEDVEPIKA